MDCSFSLLTDFLFLRQENIDKKNQHKLIQCLKAFMNNKVCLEFESSTMSSLYHFVSHTYEV